MCQLKPTGLGVSGGVTITELNEHAGFAKLLQDSPDIETCASVIHQIDGMMWPCNFKLQPCDSLGSALAERDGLSTFHGLLEDVKHESIDLNVSTDSGSREKQTRHTASYMLIDLLCRIFFNWTCLHLVYCFGVCLLVWDVFYLFVRRSYSIWVSKFILATISIILLCNCVSCFLLVASSYNWCWIEPPFCNF